MHTTTAQDNAFYDSVMPGKMGFLESAIEWIQNNMAPDDVFSKSDLESWAEENGYVQKSDD
jgi:hypothetical protein